jgi:FkbH-like protein
MRLNLELARYARASRTLVINDIHHLSARMGLERWHDRDYWYGYKMAMSHEATVLMSANVATLVRALLGRSRKCLVLDLDNTLWGGVIGDDGLTGIKLGRDTPQGSAYLDFQRFCLELKRRGVVLAVCSKNEPEIAKQAFSHPDMLLQLSDIAVFKAGWGPKHEAIREIAAELNLGLDALVFVDDNPAERELVAAQLPQVAVPNVGDQVSRFAQHLDRAGYFEAARLSGDDLQRAEQYSANAARAAAASTFANYGEYLQSLTMKAVIAPVDATYLDRVVQLTNKTNQFNLTTKRFTAAEMQAAVSDPRFVTLYGRLIDKFGDNGLVSVVQGEARGDELHLPLWLMSCRVLKRDMELAMLDALAADALRRGLKALVGYYLPTAKNAMVAEHYGALGFERVSADDAGRSTWRLDLSHGYKPRNQHIEITHDG